MEERGFICLHIVGLLDMRKKIARIFSVLFILSGCSEFSWAKNEYNSVLEARSAKRIEYSLLSKSEILASTTVVNNTKEFICVYEFTTEPYFPDYTSARISFSLERNFSGNPDIFVSILVPPEAEFRPENVLKVLPIEDVEFDLIGGSNEEKEKYLSLVRSKMKIGEYKLTTEIRYGFCSPQNRKITDNVKHSIPIDRRNLKAESKFRVFSLIESSKVSF